ncbi:MAG: hypothetical protein ACRCVT_02430 [Leadbetterella sp.]
MTVGAFTPRNVWLLRYLIPGQNQVQYLMTFTPSSEQLADPNTIQGLYLEQDGEGVMIDCISISNFNTIANSGGALTTRYSTPPTFTIPSALWYCVTRSDAGTGYAHDVLATDYVGQYIGNVRLKSNASGVSIYTFQSYEKPIAIGSDTIAQC